MLTKSQQLLLYLLELKGGVDDKTKIAKYQYFADFIHFAFNNKPISEPTIVYTRQKMGPLSRTLTEDLEYLEKNGFIKEEPAYNYKPIKKAKLTLTEEERKTAKYVINKYGDLQYSELVSICHKQEPYLSANDGGVIELVTSYNLVENYPDYASFS